MQNKILTLALIGLVAVLAMLAPAKPALAMTAEQYFADQTKEIPAGRMAEPQEIGEVIAFLASPAASYLTGQSIVVDGGYARGL